MMSNENKPKSESVSKNQPVLPSIDFKKFFMKPQSLVDMKVPSRSGNANEYIVRWKDTSHKSLSGDFWSVKRRVFLLHGRLGHR